MPSPNTARARPDRLIRWAELREIVPFSRQHIGRLEAVGKFPARVQLGANTAAWWESEVQDWIQSRPRGPVPTHLQPATA